MKPLPVVAHPLPARFQWNFQLSVAGFEGKDVLAFRKAKRTAWQGREDGKGLRGEHCLESRMPTAALPPCQCPAPHQKARTDPYRHNIHPCSCTYFQQPALYPCCLKDTSRIGRIERKISPFAAPKIKIYRKQRQNQKVKKVRKNISSVYLKALLEQKAISSEPRSCL